MTTTTHMNGFLTPGATALTADDDLALVHACREGDAAAFEKLVKRYDRKLFRIAQHVTHNREDAQDAVQEAFLKAFRKISQFQENARFATWLTRITINESLMRLRKQRTIREVAMGEDFQNAADTVSFEVADRAANPEEACRRSELRNILRRALQELRPALRVVFVLRDVEGLSTEETADVLQLTHPAVKSRLWHARRRLRERLSKNFERSANTGNLTFRTAPHTAGSLGL
jgi:RNA polymerase sigma-70 factor (ECF subfamily)